jgi:archaellum component FlaC
MSVELQRLRKRMAEVDAHLEKMEKSFEELRTEFVNLEKKYAQIVETVKSSLSMQAHVILDQLRSEIRMESARVQREARIMP